MWGLRRVKSWPIPHRREVVIPSVLLEYLFMSEEPLFQMIQWLAFSRNRGEIPSDV